MGIKRRPRCIDGRSKIWSRQGYKDIILLTLGTGVGGGIMINGALHQGLLNRAGHLGHVTQNADSDFFDVTNMPASLEEVMGDCSIGRRTLGKYTSTI